MFSSFLIGCNAVGTVAHERTNAYKDMRRLVRGLRKGPINPTLYKCFSVINIHYFNPEYFSVSLTNRNGHTIYIDQLNYQALKNWVENIKNDPTLNMYK